MVELPNVGCFLGLLGSLSSDDYEASENVDKKNEFASLQTLSLLFGSF